MDEHKGLPVAGYKPQSDDKVALVNENKELEERVLRQIDKMRSMSGHDQRMISLAHTGIQEAFMWLNRAVFQPGRVVLPEDWNKHTLGTSAPSSLEAYDRIEVEYASGGRDTASAAEMNWPNVVLWRHVK